MENSFSQPPEQITRNLGFKVLGLNLEDERSRNLGFLVRSDLEHFVFQVLQVARKCFTIKEMKRGASFRGDAHDDAVILELLRYKFRDFTVALTKLAMASSYGGGRVCVGGGGTSIADTTKEVMERDDL
ncbi:uncharacterized protein HKW66_Vig0022940 [Vigna angularis]|uniref:Uncharacterized protein n=1 Tax=Phaseolus angularis TaxID=3914 RepID=A0A8T0L7C4_PHAAN|nr:uncharacterized protein HKW66_Vig0022940 [Vigna angularis]